jgi:NADH:ubiquinone oxidoreductase subunit F (NADH-binding)
MPAKTTTPDEPDALGDYRSRYEALTGKSLHQCPACREGCMQFVELLPRRKTLPVIDTS